METKIYLNFSKIAKNALTKKVFGFGWKDVPELLQTVSGMEEDGKIGSSETRNGKKHFEVDLVILEEIVNEAKVVRKQYTASSESGWSAFDTLPGTP